MDTETQETIVDIIAEMRKSDRDKICPWWADGGSCDFCPLGRNGKNCSFSNYADRLEAAHKREKAATEADALAVGGIVGAAHKRETATAEKSSVVGDAAKLREALEAARDLLLPQCNGGTAFARACGKTVNKIMDALSAPPRNCDVGTAEEQSERYDEFCDIHDCRSDCQLFEADSCELAWAQMPYKKGGAK